MQAYLIDPTAREIKLLNVDDTLESWYRAIGCETVTRVSLTRDVDLWLDDDGHLKKGLPIWQVNQNEALLAGKGLVLGNDGEGNAAHASFPIDQLLRVVRWTELVSSGNLTEPHSEGNVVYGGNPIPNISAGELYVIWSNEHGRWWAPGACGYVERLADAGRYLRHQAIKICFDARGGWGGSGPPPEVPVREVDATAAGLGGRYVN